MHADWLRPDWPTPPNVRAVCSARAGGVSLPPYDRLNLGEHVGDRVDHVLANRQTYSVALGVRPVFMNQVHGTRVIEISHGCPDGLEADAAVTDQPSVACTVMVADCLPVLLANTQGSVVAAAHAGWRGLAGVDGVGILEQTFKRFSALAQVQSSFDATDTIAWMGPCIGPTAFEVGPEVRAAFVDGDASAAACFTAVSPGKWLADLAALARLRLHALGITQVYGNNSNPAWCTVGNATRFFSHRRDRVSGRLAASVWLAD